jgi:hypothetical protein
VGGSEDARAIGDGAAHHVFAGLQHEDLLAVDEGENRVRRRLSVLDEVAVHDQRISVQARQMDHGVASPAPSQKLSAVGGRGVNEVPSGAVEPQQTGEYARRLPNWPPFGKESNSRADEAIEFKRFPGVTGLTGNFVKPAGTALRSGTQIQNRRIRPWHWES